MNTTWKADLGQVLIPLLFMYAWIAPPLAAHAFADTLDMSPYWLGFGAGIALSVLVCLLFPSVLRHAWNHTGSMRFGMKRFFGSVLLVAMCFVPALTMSAGLFFNRAADHSPVRSHAIQVIAWRRYSKHRPECIVTSWRGAGREILTEDLFFGPRRLSCMPGETLFVDSHPGRLGWEWIERLRN